MGIKSQAGFTIIETTLFLAISGLLVLMLVIGTGASLNIQRYRDAVETFKSVVQQQYADLSNVQNGRDKNWTCDTNAVATEDGDNDTLRGQSNCFIVGKYMRIEGGALSIYTVLASQKSTSVGGNDVTSMANNYVMNVSASNVEERTMEWGTRIGWAKEGSLDVRPEGTDRSIGLLFIRSPDSGQVYTFTSDNVPAKDSITATTLKNMMVAAAAVPGQAARMVCIASDGLFVNGDMGLYIAPFAASSTSIETRSNSYSASLGEGMPQC